MQAEMGQSRPDIMTRPIALCWAAGVKWGLSVPWMQALFVRGALGRNYTGRSNDPQPEKQLAPWAPSPLIISLGRWEWHEMTLKQEGGGETLLLNTSPTDRCRWPFLNLIIVVFDVGGDSVGFSLTSLFIPAPPLNHHHTHSFCPDSRRAVSDSPLQARSFVYRRIHWDLFIYLSGGCCRCPCWRWQYSQTDPPLSLLSISLQIQSLCFFQWFINLQYLLR